MNAKSNKQQTWFKKRISLIVISMITIAVFLYLTSKMDIIFFPNPFEKRVNMVETKKLLTECKIKSINGGGLYKPGLLNQGPPPETITLIDDSTRTLTNFPSDSEYERLIKDNKTRCGFEVSVSI